MKFRNISASWLIVIVIQTMITKADGQCSYYLNSPGCPSDNKSLKLVFQDDFSGTTINSDNWISGWPNTNGDPAGGTWYDPANLQVSNGTLKMYLVNDPGNYPSAPNSSTLQHYEFRGAQIFSKMSYSIGKFEINCKIPRISKAFPAFWLWHYDTENACWQEIDVFEFLRGSPGQSVDNASSKLKMTTHKEATCGDSNSRIMVGDNYNGPDYSLAFHSFAVEWNGNEITWSVDGSAVYTQYRYYDSNGHGLSCAALASFQGVAVGECAFPGTEHPEHIVTDIVWNSTNGVISDYDPLILEVDYIKAWQYVNCSENKQVCGNIPQDKPSIDIAGNLTIGGNCTVIDNIHAGANQYNWSVSKMLATNEVAFLSEYEIKEKEMEALIVPCGESMIRGMQPTDSTTKISSINEVNYKTKNLFDFYPNPNTGFYTISSEEPLNNTVVEMFDIMGKSVYKKQFSVFRKEEIDISSLTPGVYYVKIFTTEGFNEAHTIIRQ